MRFVSENYGDSALAKRFGVTLLLFDGEGKTAATFFGAPPSLHGAAEAKLEALLGRATGAGARTGSPGRS